MAGALEGIRVIDFTWVLAGPGLTRYLGDYGAEVIKVESSRHPDLQRTSPPYNEGKPGLNRSGIWATYNFNKKSMRLNLNHPRSPELVKRLVAGADVVVENYIPGTLDKWGLGYQDLVKVKPDIIMVSISLYGQSGPFARRAGFGIFAEGMAGLLNLIGWPDRSPSTFQTVIGDALVPFFSLSTLLAALEHRDRTGEGQWLDMNQINVCSYIMAPLLLDASVNGRETIRGGNASPEASPHSVYPCAGDDRWCAIAVFSEPEWRRLCLAMGEPHWCHDPKFASFAARKANELELDKLIASWTVRFSPQQIQSLLQEKGVTAGAVLDGSGIYADPQLKHREAVWYVDHPEIGRFGYYTAPFKLSETPAEPRLPPPCLGEHTEQVCKEVLKMSDDEYRQWLSEGVFD